MVTRLQVDGFKNLREVNLWLGPFSCIAGLLGDLAVDADAAVVRGVIRAALLTDGSSDRVLLPIVRWEAA